MSKPWAEMDASDRMGLLAKATGWGAVDLLAFYDDARSTMIEDEVERRGLWDAYVVALVGAGMASSFWPPVYGRHAIVSALRATADQKAEAFCKAVGVLP